jgi:hypothetical protein
MNGCYLPGLPLHVVSHAVAVVVASLVKLFGSFVFGPIPLAKFDAVLCCCFNCIAFLNMPVRIFRGA